MGTQWTCAWCWNPGVHPQCQGEAHVARQKAKGDEAMSNEHLKRARAAWAAQAQPETIAHLLAAVEDIEARRAGWEPPMWRIVPVVHSATGTGPDSPSTALAHAAVADGLDACDRLPGQGRGGRFVVPDIEAAARALYELDSDKPWEECSENARALTRRCVADILRAAKVLP